MTSVFPFYKDIFERDNNVFGHLFQSLNLHLLYGTEMFK